MRILSFCLLFLGISNFLFSQSPSWEEFQTPVTSSLRGLSPVSDQICWASGSGGTWLKTRDGGKTWENGVIAGLDTVDFRSIYAWDELHAVVASAGQPALIYRTEDGGKSWNLVHREGEEAFFDAIYFSGDVGYVLGDPVGGKWMILGSSDRGKTWRPLENLPAALDGEAAFAASSSSLISTTEEVIFATGGTFSRLHLYSVLDKSWTVQDLDLMAQGESAKGVFAISGAKYGLILVGGDYTLPDSREGNAVLSLRSGFRIPKVSPLGYRSGVAYWKGNKTVVAVGPSGSDYSLDMGDTWISFSKIGFHAVKSSIDQGVIWASGSGGRIGKLRL
ncbi:WD40/YVTN/BNR-like repeat-containing protein [Algoriphagus confluentis]|uniref:YCF48-related protein n=1 Tax=Algoriphagus confluentis TaxID=1697556 RepID=A0ABQ6PMR2_9BACT|nr:YCF48-related protein [Algoriphagus confluentis]